MLYRSLRHGDVSRTAPRSPEAERTGIEAFKRPPVTDFDMSTATKIVLGTIGVSALLSLVLVVQAVFAGGAA